eukprot:augustus_masked-scaffold_6-processed-gene-6.54-mRNA-1 protein AED:1.00 eAED:1.00 QI:0/0/0/0/1/1/10/0/1140
MERFQGNQTRPQSIDTGTGVSSPRQVPQARKKYTSIDVESRLEEEFDRYLKRKNLSVVPARQNTQQRADDVVYDDTEQESEHSDFVESLIQSIRTLSLLTEANRTLEEADSKSRKEHGTQTLPNLMNRGYPATTNLVSLTALNMTRSTEITGAKVEEFLNEFKALRSTVANADVCYYLSIKATKTLGTRNVDMSRPTHNTIKPPPLRPTVRRKNSPIIKPQELRVVLIYESTCGIPLSRVGTTYLDDLAEAEEKEIDIKHMLVSNILEEIPEPFQEIVLGEAEIKKMEEKALLLELIEDHMKECSLKDDEKERLMLLIACKINVFGIHQSNVQMHLLSPIKYHLKPNHPPIAATGYHHTDEEEDFLAKKFRALELAGIVKKIRTQSLDHREKKKAWKAENLLHRYRMVVNMKKLNDYTIRSPLDLPNLERQTRHLRGTRYYILFDILSGLDFLSTQETSQEIFTLKHELAQIIHLEKRLGPAIPKMAELRSPFTLLINLEGKKLKDAERMQIKVEWTNYLRANFRKLLEEIEKSAKLGFEHYNRDKPLFVIYRRFRQQVEAKKIVFNDMNSSLSDSSLYSEVDEDSLERTISCFNAQVENILDSIKVRQVLALLAGNESKSGEEEEEAASNEITDTRVNEIETTTTKETIVPGRIQDLKSALDQHPLCFVNPYYSDERYDPLKGDTLIRRQGEMEPIIKEKMKMKNKLLYFKGMLKGERGGHPRCNRSMKEHTGITTRVVSEEKEVLKSAIQILGCGMYTSYIELDIFPYRSKQQICTQIQKQLNIQSINFLHGLKFDVDKVRSYLDAYWGCKDYKVRKPRITIEKQEYEQLRSHITRNIKEFTGNYDRISYCRQLFDIDHVKLILQEQGKQEQRKFLEANYVMMDMFEKQVSAFDESRQQAVLKTQPFTDVLETLLLNYNQSLKDLNNLQLYQVAFRVQEPHLKEVPRKTYRNVEGSAQVQDSKEVKIRIHLKDDTKRYFFYKRRNKFETAGGEGITTFLKPLNSSPTLGDMFNFRFSGLKNSPNRFEIIVLDPTWNSGVSSPTRGIALDYPTLTLRQIFEIMFSVKNYPYGSYLLLWTVNMAFVGCLEWMKNQQFYLVDYIPWIKKFASGIYNHAMGHYLTHYKEHCPLFQRKSSSTL